MDTIHDFLSPWVGSHPIIALLAALAIGFVAGLVVRGKKKKD
jgi:hypothetical protein